MARTANVIDCYGQPSRLKLRRIREHQAAGAGKWVDDVFVFTRRSESIPAVRHSPSVGRIVSRRVEHFGGGDSGFGFLRYPMPSGGTGVQFPALAKAGAGL